MQVGDSDPERDQVPKVRGTSVAGQAGGMKIAVFLDHDIVIRHFVLSGVLEPLRKAHDVSFWFPHKHRRVRLDLNSLHVSPFHTLNVDEQRAFRQRRLYQATVLRNSRWGNERELQKRMWRSMLGRRGYWETWSLSMPGAYQAFRAWSRAMIGEAHNLSDALYYLKPDLILHPTALEGLFVDDLARLGRKRGIKTVFIMNSWDNPSTKAMISEHPDKLIVWGEHSEKDAIRHMKTPPESIIRLGAAQYDVYRKPPKVSPQEWRARLSIGNNTRVLLYAGSNQGLNETEHLRLLDEGIEGGRLPNTTVVYRPHPWRPYPAEEKDFFAMRFKHVRMDPSSQASYLQSRGSGRVMVELADYEDTHSTLNAVDAVISPLSSILLEAALHGKTVAAYVRGMEIRHFYWTFFERVPCFKIEAEDRIVGACARMLGPRAAHASARELSYFVEPSDRPWGERLLETINAL